MRLIGCLLFCLLAGYGVSMAQVSAFAEFGTAVHAGDHTPLWQVSNLQGLGSIYNNGYVRGGVEHRYAKKGWSFEEQVDVVGAVGDSFKKEASFIVQQAYADVRFKWLGLYVGSRELGAPLVDNTLSSGDMTWSGNARPIPQVRVGIPEYLYLFRRFAIKGNVSYGWFTDNSYLKKQVGEGYWYTKSIKYHHKEGFMRIGVPDGRWQFDVGLVMDTQFGGYMKKNGTTTDLGNSFKDYLRVLFPGSAKDNGEKPSGEVAWYQGNYLGSEQVMFTYRGKHVSASGYLLNHFDDFSGMGKLNGWDGLWGLELGFKHFAPVRSVVVEYLQTTNMSGPLHGMHDKGSGPVEKTGGADNYYNNGCYQGWSHWGMMIANPLIASPVYNEDGDMTLKYTRVRAFHLAWCGEINAEWSYTAKMSHNRTWGKPFAPTLDILKDFSFYSSFTYTPRWGEGWSFNGSFAFDTGDIYGDNVGLQVKVRKTF